MADQKEGFGVEEFINLLMALLAFYARHKSEIDQFIGSGNTASMTALLAEKDNLQAVNPPGPNQEPNNAGL